MSGLPTGLTAPGQWAEVFGEQQRLETLAAQAGLPANALLSATAAVCGKRYHALHPDRAPRIPLVGKSAMRTPLILILALVGRVADRCIRRHLLTVRIEQQAIDQTREAHEKYVLGTLRNTIEANLTLGLTLEQSSSLQQLIERGKSGYRTFGHQHLRRVRPGALQHGPGTAGRPHAGRLGARRPESEGVWCIDGHTVRSCGIALQDELGQKAGGLVLAAPHAERAYSLQAWLARGEATLALAALAMLVAGWERSGWLAAACGRSCGPAGFCGARPRPAEIRIRCSSPPGGPANAIRPASRPWTGSCGS